MITVREARETEWDEVMILAWITFRKCNSPEYGKEGEASFLSFITDNRLKEAFLKGQYKLFVAVLNGETVGMVSLRPDRRISLLFVSQKYQRMGIGTRLIGRAQEYIREASGDAKHPLRVYAAPCAIGFYRKQGFYTVGDPFESEGMVMVPMERGKNCRPDEKR